MAISMVIYQVVMAKLKKPMLASRIKIPNQEKVSLEIVKVRPKIVIRTAITKAKALFNIPELPVGVKYLLTTLTSSP